MIPFCKILQTHFRNGLQFFFPFFFENKKLGILGRFCEKLGTTKKKTGKTRNRWRACLCQQKYPEVPRA